MKAHRSPFAVLSLLACAALAGPAAAQDRRPQPYPVVPEPGYAAAVDAGTRSADGSTGPDYWQGWTDYRIRARLSPGANRLEGRARIAYHNRSPDTLRTLYLHLHQNLHAEGTVRNEPQEVTGGVELGRVAVDGTALDRRPEGADADGGAGWSVDATILRLDLPAPLAPGAAAEIEVEYGFTVPKSGAGRMGRDDGLFYLGYWYPQMAVYDDVVGWHTDPYLGRAEFYMGYGSYDVAVTLPEGWVVRATGTQRNAGETLAPAVHRRLERAGGSDSVVHVLTADDFGPGSATVDAPGDSLTWRFTADTVRDFAFSATRRSVWDAARAPVGDRDGDGETDFARVEALYRREAPKWSRVWDYARHALSFHSEFTGFPYPWPHMTAVEGGGIIGGGMEYPMMTIMGDYRTRGDSALYYVTAHELAHMWVPMIVGNDEKRYAWMDEGFATFTENQARKDRFPGQRSDLGDLRDYTELARTGHGDPVMRWMDHQYPRAGNVPNYDKPATALVGLRAILGDGVFREALSTFVGEWAYRHPYPWDFFRTVERVADRELGWFWRSWYYETWPLDHGIAAVEGDRRDVTIEVVDLGWMPMPVLMEVTLADGLELRREIGVETFLEGRSRVVIELQTPSPVVRVELDPEHRLPDLNRDNNVWERSP